MHLSLTSNSNTLLESLSSRRVKESVVAYGSSNYLFLW